MVGPHPRAHRPPTYPEGEPMSVLIAALLALVAALSTAPAPTPTALTPDLVADVLSGDYEPTAATDVLQGWEWDALLIPYSVEQTLGYPCRAMALTMMRTGDYRPDMVGCFGPEDSVTVDVILRAAGK